ncbi:anti-repressor SinI family protein [Bacillus sp. FJAT-44742]|uniref:anti-repressor SinI family protein n=1 Tax=Bacillus sp. FJAT-44742 TaxID=2014005 RepID=UPI000C242F26|nr:anti-repressor SinI family protein [Bacillus sp. FJAT-44742]
MRSRLEDKVWGRLKTKQETIQGRKEKREHSDPPLSKEWMELVEEAMESKVTKEEFYDFLLAEQRKKQQ